MYFVGGIKFNIGYPMVRTEFPRWQHKRIIKALLYQGYTKMVLRYITSVRPALTTPEEMKFKLTVLLANEYVQIFVVIYQYP